MPDTCFSLALDVPNSKITEVPFALRARRVCFQQFPTRWLPASGRTKNIFCFIADKDWDYFRQILSIEGFLVPRGPRRSRRQSPLPDSVLRFQNRSWQFFLQPGFGISSLAKPINGLPEMIPACRTRPKKFLAARLRPCQPRVRTGTSRRATPSTAAKANSRTITGPIRWRCRTGTWQVWTAGE